MAMSVSRDWCPLQKNKVFFMGNITQSKKHQKKKTKSLIRKPEIYHKLAKK